MHPEIGVMFRREQHPASLIAYARKAEAMGFDQLWVAEDCFFLGGIAQAAIALAATTRIKVGVGIVPAMARNAAYLAMEYATLGAAFPGRVIGGIGHGFGGWMEQVGAKPPSWLRSLEDVTTAVRAIMRGETVTTASAYVTLDGVKLEHPPEVVPPVLLGVQSEKSVRLAGTCADGLLLAEGAGPEYVRWARSLMEQGRAEAGREGSGSVVVYANCLVDGDDPAGARQRMREVIADWNTDDLQPQVARMPFAAELRSLAAQGGRQALLEGIPDAWVDDLAVTGDEASARRSIERLADAGADAVVLVPRVGVDYDAWLDAPFMHVVAASR